MDDKTPMAPFALPTEQQVFGTQMETAQPQVPEPVKRRRGRPANPDKTTKPATKRQTRKPAAKPVQGFTVEQVHVLRGLSESAFSVVTAIMDRVPQAEWRSIATALQDLLGDA